MLKFKFRFKPSIVCILILTWTFCHNFYTTFALYLCIFHQTIHSIPPLHTLTFPFNSPLSTHLKLALYEAYWLLGFPSFDHHPFRTFFFFHHAHVLFIFSQRTLFAPANMFLQALSRTKTKFHNPKFQASSRFSHGLAHLDLTHNFSYLLCLWISMCTCGTVC